MADRDGDGWPDIEPLPELPPPPRPAPPVSPAPPPSLRPTPPWPPQPPPGSPYPPSTPRPNVTAWWVTGMLAVFVFVLIVVGVSTASDDSDDGDDERATPTTAADEPDPVDDDAQSSTTTTEATTTTASTEPPLPPPGFGEGTLMVGADIQPGRYMTSGGFACYWERRSAVDNGFDGLIANGGGGPAVVEILASDTAFMSRSCDPWVDYAPPSAPATTFGDGDWVVGEQIEAGTYRVDSPFAVCMWERASGFTHDLAAEAIAYDFEVSAGDTVRLAAGERFTSSLCGTWTLL